MGSSVDGLGWVGKMGPRTTLFTLAIVYITNQLIAGCQVLLKNLAIILKIALKSRRKMYEKVERSLFQLFEEFNAQQDK